MLKETTQIIKTCTFIVLFFWAIDLLTTVIVIQFLNFKEVNIFPAGLIHHFGLWGFVLIAIFFVIPLITFAHVLFFPLLFNFIIPTKFKYKDKIIRLFCCIGTGILVVRQILTVSANLSWIFYSL